MSQSLKQKYLKLYPKFITILPMDDAMFLGSLIAAGLFPGNTKNAVNAKPTNADRAAEFLSKCIDPGFSDDGNSNELLDKLLTAMKETDFQLVQQLAKEFESQCK